MHVWNDFILLHRLGGLAQLARALAWLTIRSDAPDKTETHIVPDGSLSATALQLETFRTCLLGGNEIHNSLENEIRAQIACQRIHEKMRINFNVF